VAPATAWVNAKVCLPRPLYQAAMRARALPVTCSTWASGTAMASSPRGGGDVGGAGELDVGAGAGLFPGVQPQRARAGLPGDAGGEFTGGAGFAGEVVAGGDLAAAHGLVGELGGCPSGHADLDQAASPPAARAGAGSETCGGEGGVEPQLEVGGGERRATTGERDRRQIDLEVDEGLEAAEQAVAHAREAALDEAGEAWSASSSMLAADEGAGGRRAGGWRRRRRTSRARRGAGWGARAGGPAGAATGARCRLRGRSAGRRWRRGRSR
jgi:hypothetical protein